MKRSLLGVTDHNPHLRSPVIYAGHGVMRLGKKITLEVTVANTTQFKNLILCFLCKINTTVLIGRAKGTPHWGVQSRFCVIYMCRSVGRYVCRVPKCVGGITCAHAQSQFWAVKTDL